MKLGQGSTPGPWNETYGTITDSKNRIIAEVHNVRRPIPNGREREANGTLIAKAPLLIEAREVLEKAEGELDRMEALTGKTVDATVIMAIRVLLAKLDA